MDFKEKDENENNLNTHFWKERCYDRRTLLATRDRERISESFTHEEKNLKLMSYNEVRVEYSCSLCSNVLTSSKCLPINFKNHQEFIDHKATRWVIEKRIEKENLRPYKGTKTIIVCKQCRCVNLRRSFNKWTRTLKEEKNK